MDGRLAARQLHLQVYHGKVTTADQRFDGSREVFLQSMGQES